MTNPGNGKALLGGSGGEQGTGSAEQDGSQISLLKFVQKIAAERHSTASAAGTTGVHILIIPVKNQGTTVFQTPAEGQAILACKRKKHLFSPLAQITGDDQIVVLRLFIQVLQVGIDGGVGVTTKEPFGSSPPPQRQD